MRDSNWLKSNLPLMEQACDQTQIFMQQGLDLQTFFKNLSHAKKMCVAHFGNDFEFYTCTMLENTSLTRLTIILFIILFGSTVWGPVMGRFKHFVNVLRFTRKLPTKFAYIKLPNILSIHEHQKLQHFVLFSLFYGRFPQHCHGTNYWAIVTQLLGFKSPLSWRVAISQGCACSPRIIYALSKLY